MAFDLWMCLVSSAASTGARPCLCTGEGGRRSSSFALCASMLERRDVGAVQRLSSRAGTGGVMRDGRGAEGGLRRDGVVFSAGYGRDGHDAACHLERIFIEVASDCWFS